MMKHGTALIAAAMIVIGSLKTWLHMGTIPVLSLPSCNGETLTVAMSNASWLERAHCWGCYMLVAGLALLAIAVAEQATKRRSVAS